MSILCEMVDMVTSGLMGVLFDMRLKSDWAHNLIGDSSVGANIGAQSP